MDAKIQNETLALIHSAAKLLETAVASSPNGIDGSELPAIIAHAEHVKCVIDRLLLIATEQANRKSWHALDAKLDAALTRALAPHEDEENVEGAAV